MVGMAKQPEAEQSNRDYRRRPDGICQNRGRIAEEIERTRRNRREERRERHGQTDASREVGTKNRRKKEEEEEEEDETNGIEGRKGNNDRE